MKLLGYGSGKVSLKGEDGLGELHWLMTGVLSPWDKIREKYGLPSGVNFGFRLLLNGSHA